MPNENHAETEVVKIHPDGRRAVVCIRANGRSYYQAFGPDGFGVGVYDLSDEAEAAAQWAWDFLQEEPALRRLALMQLIVDKLKLQFPLESPEVVLGLKE
ncbi:MAG TPA: hypothetical protein VIR76_05935 [Pusillimonas sp.]